MSHHFWLLLSCFSSLLLGGWLLAKSQDYTIDASQIGSVLFFLGLFLICLTAVLGGIDLGILLHEFIS